MCVVDILICFIYLCKEMLLYIVNNQASMKKRFFFSLKVLQLIKNITFAPGELAEWSNAVVLKTIDPSRDPGVRIPYSPQN